MNHKIGAVCFVLGASVLPMLLLSTQLKRNFDAGCKGTRRRAVYTHMLLFRRVSIHIRLNNYPVSFCMRSVLGIVNIYTHMILELHYE